MIAIIYPVAPPPSRVNWSGTMAPRRHARSRRPLLMDDLIEEVLFRLPPNDPRRRRLQALAPPRLRRRFREFHRAPPMLGLLCNLKSGSIFVPTCPSCPILTDSSNLRVIDARHGRVLLRTVRVVPGLLGRRCFLRLGSGHRKAHAAAGDTAVPRVLRL